MSKKYLGCRFRDEHGAPHALAVLVVDERGVNVLPTRRDLYNHSPNGFEWGYAGSGPAQLALALCADVLRDGAHALRVYQAIKELLIVPLQTDQWVIEADRVRAAIERVEAVA